MTKSTELQQKANDLFIPLYPHKNVALKSAQGCYVTDMEGNKHLDCAGGIAVCSLGHNHPAFIKGIQDQINTGLTMCVGSIATEAKVNAAEILINNCCTDKIFFCNSGAEAVEGALKLARKWAHLNKSEECKEIIVFRNSFHGRTYGAVSGTEKALHQPQFGPYLPGFHFAVFNDLESVKKVMSDKTCAVLVEPVQGEGGLDAGTKEFLQGLQKLCNQNKVLMISDEIQAGMGRMGKLFAHAHFEYEPDVITLAKGIGGGFPVAAFMAKKQYADIFVAGEHGTTYGGNPLAVSVVYNVISEIVKPEFLQHVRDMSAHFYQKLEALKEELGDVIIALKGEGLMIGIDTKFKVSDILNELLKNNMLATQAGANTLRLTPPLIITKPEIDEAVEKIRLVLKDEDKLCPI